MRVLLESIDAVGAAELAIAWAQDIAVASGEPAAGASHVILVLLDEAASATRPRHVDAAALERALAAGVAVAVHDEALLRRGGSAVVDGVKTLAMTEIADLLAEPGARAVWR